MINHKLLHDPRETVAGVRQLYARVRATAYAVLIVPTPTGSRGAIARDVLRGLGKHLDGRDTPRTPSGLNDAARVWLQAHEITTLIIRNADRLDPSAWQEARNNPTVMSGVAMGEPWPTDASPHNPRETPRP